jgi:hypothetical protein
MRWKDMVICYNDRTNNTIADLRDDGVVNSSVKEEQQQTKERMREDGCFYDCGDEAAAAISKPTGAFLFVGWGGLLGVGLFSPLL